MINPTKLEIDKIYSRIDKIAKKGSDNYIEYYSYIDQLVKDSKYGFLKECLDVKYDYNISYLDLDTVKKESWKEILFRTNTNFQDSFKKILKSKGLIQNGLNYYIDVPLTSAKIIDSTGSGCELQPVIIDDYVDSIKVIRSGSAYSASASIVITGGIGTASATPIIKAGRVYSVIVNATGSYHNKLYKIGKIEESDEYETPITNKFSKDLYQRLIKNKKTYLITEKEGYTQSATFSSWNFDYTYDKNIINLYTQAVNYLLS
jgi:hypothetical protein